MTPYSALPQDFWNLEMADVNITRTVEDERLVRNVETIQFCFFCITLTVHLTIIWALFDAHSRKFQELMSSFFKLCLSTAGIDIWTLLTNYFGAMFAKWGWFVPVYMFLGRGYTHVYLYFAWSTGICQAMGVSILAANRLSVMLFPTIFHLMWKGYRIWVAISIQYIFGLSVGISTFFNPTQLFRNEQNGIVPKFLNVTMTNIFFVIGGVFLFVNCLFLVLTYCYLFIVLHERNKKTPPRPTRHISKRKELARMREAKLFTMSTITVCVQMSVLLLFIFGGSDILGFSTDQFYMVYNALSDLYASINPYLLWIFSDTLRRYVLQRLGFAKREINITSVTPIFVLP
ncbi:G_PROTEIN_RECEP_F1_2 domain-containing protein [Caenorhabditis elegans]|uniref:G_PROTEIN_RECEP_F1_2 domain-containing protein n=1 Tax=Caenorhabditis elegans TaxID=6239 RepID=Q22148_CAEEL|nr:G_PROTEIN_RECEP_F1_2 domain-containing protein [Caenorhabditis elegans]CAA92611.2 G_PROTEIN_RECEP_F1_2 domain-containing protein [Caenorhabditis elegans]|eukprot:NP_501820.2 Serpentine Receptor, class V [Caenorhabditis elegans]